MNRTGDSQILWVHPHMPWSAWTNSGASRAFCMELRKRGLLRAAVGPDFVSRLYARGAGLGYQTMMRLQKRYPWGFPGVEQWTRESDGALGRWIKRMPDDSAVVYVFDLPEPTAGKKIKRYLFLNLSAYDARRTASWDFEKMGEADFVEFCKHQRRMMDWSDGLVTPSTYAADSIARDFGYPREKITPMGYGPAVALEEIPTPAIERYAAANILFIGRDWDRKGGPLVLGAWEKVKERLPHCTLTIVGPNEAPVQGEGIHFVGYLDKTTRDGVARMTQEYARASVFCMPTRCEPWGLVFSESAAMGLPIVSFRDWSLPDIVEDGVSGRLIDQPDADSLAGALLDVLEEPKRSLSMGQNAQRRVREILNWPSCTDRLLSRVLPEAVAGKNVPLMQAPASISLSSGNYVHAKG